MQLKSAGNKDSILSLSLHEALAVMKGMIDQITEVKAGAPSYQQEDGSFLSIKIIAPNYLLREVNQKLAGREILGEKKAVPVKVDQKEPSQGSKSKKKFRYYKKPKKAV